MTTSLRYTCLFTTVAVLATTGAAWLATDRLWLPAAGLLYTVVLATWIAAREYANHKRVVAEHEWARRRALGEQPPPLDPCCRLGRASYGAAHDDRCTDLTTRQHNHPESTA
ncbi:hypothetical protein ACFUN7_24385 [Streptomyces sp. NPDC057236]|uniref:hypothetical protein n=1 Tax=Streptomyces sp. NPDC057236 TaxID=3346059 RepID=UPI00363A3A53